MGEVAVDRIRVHNRAYARRFGDLVLEARLVVCVPAFDFHGGRSSVYRSRVCNHVGRHIRSTAVLVHAGAVDRFAVSAL